MWPFNSKPAAEPATIEPKSRTITINVKDEPLDRARKILEGSGIVINATAHNQLLPWIALALEKYQRLDYAAGVRRGRLSKSKEDEQ